MATHFDPEGNESVLFDTSALSLIVPGDVKVYIYASFDSAWEQAVVFYVNGERVENQIGSFILRPNSVIIPQQASQYELTMVAWHKRSSANPDLPWVASRVVASVPWSLPGTTPPRTKTTGTSGSSSSPVDFPSSGTKGSHWNNCIGKRMLIESSCSFWNN